MTLDEEWELWLMTSEVSYYWSIVQLLNPLDDICF